MSVINQVISIKTKPKKRLGRGYGSGKGGYAGAGIKGQNSRRGGGVPLWFEGGQLPMVRKFPFLRGKQRMKNINPVAELNFDILNKVKSDVISLETLKLEKIIAKKFKKAKVIVSGKLKKKLINFLFYQLKRL